MPVGIPRLSDNKNLHDLFGFVAAKVTAPTSKKLKVAILPKLSDSGTLNCPIGCFEGVWFSEELKNAVKYGYKVEVITSIVFERGKGVLNNFVTTLYNKRLAAKANNQQTLSFIVKLLLNSLYGKFGQKPIESHFKFRHISEMEKHRKKYETDLEHTFGDKVLVRDHGKNKNKKILDLVEYSDATLEDISLYEEPLESQPLESQPLDSVVDEDMLNTGYSDGGVDASVCIAAAVTAYGRIHMSIFKNMKKNQYFGGDTDSSVMLKPLDDKFVGKELGKMKLEFNIKVGLFANKKLYYLVTETGDKISKSIGIGLGRSSESILKADDYIKILGGEVVTVLKPKFIIKKDNVYYRDEKVRVSVPAEILDEIRGEVLEYISSTSPRSKSLKATIPRRIAKVLKKVEKANNRLKNSKKS